MAMETKRLGRTGMQVGRLGIGLSEVGFNLELTDVGQARSVINQALDSGRSEEHTSELQSLVNLVCRLLLEKKKQHS